MAQQWTSGKGHSCLLKQKSRLPNLGPRDQTWGQGTKPGGQGHSKGPLGEGIVVSIMQTPKLNKTQIYGHMYLIATSFNDLFDIHT